MKCKALVTAFRQHYYYGLPFLGVVNRSLFRPREIQGFSLNLVPVTFCLRFQTMCRASGIPGGRAFVCNA
jgi:hypothetical protein